MVNLSMSTRPFTSVNGSYMKKVERRSSMVKEKFASQEQLHLRANSWEQRNMRVNGLMTKCTVKELTNSHQVMNTQENGKIM